MIRRVTIVNPGVLRSQNVTDRAKRYRAYADGFKPEGPKRCNYCGSRRNVGIEHISGDESDGDPQNLMWACKTCNARVAVVVKRAGLGRRVDQMNPKKRAGGTGTPTLREYGAAIKVMRGEFEGDVSKAMATIRKTPRSVRSSYTSKTWPTRRAIYGKSGRAQGRLFDDVPF